MSGDSNEFRDGLIERIRHYTVLSEELRARIADLADELGSVERRLAAAQDLFHAEFANVTGPVPEPWSPSPSSGVLSGAPWAQAIIQTLRAAGVPLHANDLWARMHANGFTTNSRDPLRSLASIAVRHPELISLGGNTFGLKEALVQSSPNGGPSPGDGAAE